MTLLYDEWSDDFLNETLPYRLTVRLRVGYELLAIEVASRYNARLATRRDVVGPLARFYFFLRTSADDAICILRAHGGACIRYSLVLAEPGGVQELSCGAMTSPETVPEDLPDPTLWD
jgi:hypothetical protein